MKKVFIDTNVVIDFYQVRQPFFNEAATIFQLALDRKIQMLISTTTVVNAFYLLRKSYPVTELYEKLRALFMLAQVVETNAETVASALTEEWKDFEDCIQYVSADSSDADIILTRNKKDYEKKTIPVMTPTEFLAMSNRTNIPSVKSVGERII